MEFKDLTTELTAFLANEKVNNTTHDIGWNMSSSRRFQSNTKKKGYDLL